MEQQPLGMFGTIMYVYNHWNDIQNQWSLIVQAFIGLVGLITTLASMITPLTRTPKDDALLKGVIDWMHQFSFTNAKDVKGVGQQPVPPQKTELPTTKNRSAYE